MSEGAHFYRLGKEDGCIASPSCFTCPLIECRYEYEGRGTGGLFLALEKTFESGMFSQHLKKAFESIKTVSWLQLSEKARDAIGLPWRQADGQSDKDHIIALYRWGVNINCIATMKCMTNYKVAKYLSEEVSNAA